MEFGGQSREDPVTYIVSQIFLTSFGKKQGILTGCKPVLRSPPICMATDLLSAQHSTGLQPWQKVIRS